jgi:hypothetical protein
LWPISRYRDTHLKQAKDPGLTNIVNEALTGRDILVRKTMPIKFSFAALMALVIILVCPDAGLAQSATIDTSAAYQYFREAQAASERDAGKLWGMPVCGPLLFVDPVSHMVVANQSDHLGLLTRKDEVFVGKLPDSVAIANYTTTWAGVRWAMIVWPFLTQDRSQRVQLMAHESFHCIQNRLLLPGVRTNNAHLDTEEGRIWLQLEWRALRLALTTSGAAHRRAVEDALTFRNYRRSLFPQSDASERAAELTEGLAEYTGYRLSAKDTPEIVDRVSKAIEREAARPNFVASFAYCSGPAYAVLLDTSDPQWRKGLTVQQDLGSLLQRSLKIELSADLKAMAEKQAFLYDGEALRASEAKRNEKRQDQIAEDRKRFLDGPTLLILLSDKRSITVVSNNMVPIDGVGTVYPTSRIIDEWGVLEITKGALMIQNEGGRIMQVYLSPPQDPKGRPLKGEGWTLKLTPGWSIVPGSREGDFLLKRLEP